MTLRRTFRTILFLTMGVILFFALGPIDAVPDVTGWDKTNHLIAFGTLSVLARPAYPDRFWGPQLALLGLGVLIEVLQYFVPPRSADWKDVVADAIGLLIGVLLVKSMSVAFTRTGQP